jgi:alanyl-tRNA synthetase
MEQEFKDKLTQDATLQAKVLDILKGTEVGKAYTETVAKNYFEQNVGSEHRKIYDFVDNALKSEGLDKPEGVKTSEWVNMIAKQNKELSDKISTMSANPDKLAEQIDALTQKHKKEKQNFNKVAQDEIAKRDAEIQQLKQVQTDVMKQSEIQKSVAKLEFNKGLDEKLINDIIQVKTQILIHNSKIEDGVVVWCKPDGTPIKDGILNASLDSILRSEFDSVLHKTVGGGQQGSKHKRSF